jgi:hypothetical protein
MSGCPAAASITSTTFPSASVIVMVTTPPVAFSCEAARKN